jgi:hypothetical protein
MLTRVDDAGDKKFLPHHRLIDGQKFYQVGACAHYKKNFFAVFHTYAHLRHKEIILKKYKKIRGAFFIHPSL